MPICPNCNKPIDSLLEEKDAAAFYKLSLVDGKPNYKEDGSQPQDTVEYSCPSCYDDMGFYTQEEAIAFLKGEA